MDKLDRAIFLKAQIKELEHFLFVVTEFDEGFKGIPSVNVFIKKEVEVQFSLLGSRFFGCGTHRQEVKVPDSIRNIVIFKAQEVLDNYKWELEGLFI